MIRSLIENKEVVQAPNLFQSTSNTTKFFKVKSALIEEKVIRKIQFLGRLFCPFQKRLKIKLNHQAEDGKKTNLLLFEVLLSKCYTQRIMKPVHSLGGIVQEKKLRMTVRDKEKLLLTALKFSAGTMSLQSYCDSLSKQIILILNIQKVFFKLQISPPMILTKALHQFLVNFKSPPNFNLNKQF
ncbi:hypothetical protein TTHERM_00701230 (macronuclear) [Tetrahymena thermophila SB210]|uniref:Uncharacterized protein n=1 Tax=Tetrahymena thermophila (strain SB210) TaxID=312017 RepID=Q22LM6_TETTS|nr:hypothetical protein TTHERM_00701230 [Tetrahymena thermophila SB210]EAR86240.3 hypothetical protein TTHERM_00701230 [Tetrahymena thermophila SB210]|eukprot:XP_976835.3 hypothetical protein TTHERM_00701230 [Tetrahymena thermophila SB210]